jgi:hypothetical protein
MKPQPLTEDEQALTARWAERIGVDWYDTIGNLEAFQAKIDDRISALLTLQRTRYLRIVKSYVLMTDDPNERMLLRKIYRGMFDGEW